MGREIRLIRALADEGYQFTLNDGVPPIPRDKMVTFTSLPKHLAKRFMDEIEAGGIPVVMLRGDGQINPDGIRDYDLLVPASVETLVVERHADARDALPARRRWLARAVHRRARGHPAAQPPVRALLQRTTGARVRVDGEVVGEIGAGWSSCSASDPTTAEATADDLARKAAELRIFRDDEGRTNRSLLDIGGAALVVSQFTLLRGHAPGPPAGVHRRRAAGARRAALPPVRRRRSGPSA